MIGRCYQYQRLIPYNRPLQQRIGCTPVQHEANVHLSFPDFGHQIRFLLGLQMNVQSGKCRPQLLQKRRKVKGGQ
ncbi:hypothetical protein D3C75_881130 [compost metagenome]